MRSTSFFPSEIRKLPGDNGGAYFSNLFLNHNMYTRVSEQAWFGSSCGYTRRILNEIPSPSPEDDQRTQQSSESANDKNEPSELLGSLPFGLISSGRGINPQKIARLSTNIVHVNATDSTHISILHVEEESRMVTDVVNAIWEKITTNRLF
jgi:hypothetical protein